MLVAALGTNHANVRVTGQAYVRFTEIRIIVKSEILKTSFLDKLRNESLIFREAIENCSSELGITFKYFPKGSCGDTSILLGTYLMDKQYGQFYYMNSEIGEISSTGLPVFKSHAWLQNEGNIIVDITADQFPDIAEKVIVSYGSDWHLRWKGEKQNIANINVYDERTKMNMQKMYNRVLMEILREERIK